MWELDYKESWMPKNWCFWTVVLEKTLESPLDCKETQPVHPKGNQSWIFIGRTDPEAEAPVVWPPDVKNWLIGKDPDVGQDWRQKEKGMTEDEMTGWHHRLDGHEFEQAPGVGDGKRSLACCIHGVTKSGTQLRDWIELNIPLYMCTTSSLSIPLSKEIQVVYILATVNSAVTNIGVPGYFWSSFLQIYSQEWDCWVIWQLYFSFLRIHHTVFHSGNTNLHCHQQWRRVPFLHILSSIICRFCNDGTSVKWYLIEALICILFSNT